MNKMNTSNNIVNHECLSIIGFQLLDLEINRVKIGFRLSEPLGLEKKLKESALFKSIKARGFERKRLLL